MFPCFYITLLPLLVFETNGFAIACRCELVYSKCLLQRQVTSGLFVPFPNTGPKAIRSLPELELLVLSGIAIVGWDAVTVSSS